MPHLTSKTLTDYTNELSIRNHPNRPELLDSLKKDFLRLIKSFNNLRDLFLALNNHEEDVFYDLYKEEILALITSIEKYNRIPVGLSNDRMEQIYESLKIPQPVSLSDYSTQLKNAPGKYRLELLKTLKEVFPELVKTGADLRNLFLMLTIEEANMFFDLFKKQIKELPLDIMDLRQINISSDRMQELYIYAEKSSLPASLSAQKPQTETVSHTNPIGVNNDLLSNLLDELDNPIEESASIEVPVVTIKPVSLSDYITLLKSTGGSQRLEIFDALKKDFSTLIHSEANWLELALVLNSVEKQELSKQFKLQIQSLIPNLKELNDVPLDSSQNQIEIAIIDPKKKDDVAISSSNSPNLIPQQSKPQNKEKEQTILDAINFENYLKIFMEKASKYRSSEREEDVSAVTEAQKLHRALKLAQIEFLESNQAKKLPIFKAKCLKAIEDSRDVLEQHRGWKQLFANFASAIVSLVSFGISNYLTGRGFFSLFPTSTDSKENLDNFKSALNTDLS